MRHKRALHDLDEDIRDHVERETLRTSSGECRPKTRGAPHSDGSGSRSARQRGHASCVDSPVV